MIGVVVWSSEDREKAIIWCEDHGALAYLQGSEHFSNGGVWPATGDLLELSSETIGNLRHARCVSMLNEGYCPTIPAILGSGTAPKKPHIRLVATGEGRGPAISDFPEADDFPTTTRVSAAG